MTAYQTICDIIFKLYLYADAAKMIHYSTDSMHGHKLADDVRDAILEFADELAEQYFGYYGKPRYSQLSVSHEINADEDINKLCKNCIAMILPIRSSFNESDQLSGIVSLIDSFKEKMAKMVFLGTFDKASKSNTKLL